MKYEEKKAKELGQRHGLSYFTLNRWKKKRQIPNMYLNNGERLIQGMTLREAKNYTKLTISQIQALLFVESGDEKTVYHKITISYWFSGKRNPSREWIWNILDRHITRKKLGK
jgi:hypothetical protein